MINKTSQKTIRLVILMFVFLALVSGAYSYSNWQIYKDDDGTLDSHWGFCGGANGLLRKTFVLESVEGVKDAVIRYEIAAQPYHYLTKEYYGKPQQGVQWNDMVIMVNDVLVAKESPMELGTKGWHRVQFDAKLLKKGENTVTFTWAKEGTKEGEGGFYMGIDTATHKGRSSSSCDGGKTFSTECLRPGCEILPECQGEYMVRLFVAFADNGAEAQSAGNTEENAVNPFISEGNIQQGGHNMVKKWLWLMALTGLMGGNVLCVNAEEWKPVFTDDFNRSDVLGPDWEIKSGKWDIRPGNLKAIGPNTDAVIMCTRLFQVPFRIEYECYSDDPCDLSIMLNKKKDGDTFCFVGFGSEYNLKNKIIFPKENEATAVQSLERLIEVGRKHKVAVEVGEDGIVKQIIDGQEILKAKAPVPPKKLFFGFYVWTKGVFNTVKVFSPHSVAGEALEKKSAAAGEKIPTVRQFKSFNDYPVGVITDTNIAVTVGDKCAVKITDMPTWLYCFRKGKDYEENEDPSKPEPAPGTVTNHGARFVADPCVELMDENPEAGKSARISIPVVPALKSGLVEFDLMADQYTGDGIRVDLGGKSALWINKDGEFFWQAGTNTIELPKKMLLYPSLGDTARFYLQPRRWFTIRIDFDLETSLANVVIVKMFTAEPSGYKCPQAEFLVVGDDLPMPADAVERVNFETCGTGRFFVDNVFMISRTEDLKSDEKWRVPARQIMQAYYPLRKDPFDLKVWSMRNVRGGGLSQGDEMGDLLTYPERYAVILKCAEMYNEILIRQAFLGEKLRGLERAWIYSRSVTGARGPQETNARQAVDTTEKLLNELYQFYAECYLDRLNQVKLKDGFETRYQALNNSVQQAETLVENEITGLRQEVIAKTRCRFTPYPIEPADDQSAPVKFTDSAFRRDGKRTFFFTRYSLYWPEMYKVLNFDPDAKTCGVDDCVNKAKEPEYCTASNTAFFWNMTHMLRRPDEQVQLRTYYGNHNHVSMLPKWWAEKHRSDPDIFLQNSRGQMNTDTNLEFAVCGQYNYWNADVLSAQKATLESIGDMIAHNGWGQRVAYIEYPAEAYFLMVAEGGSWETGYNKSAVKAFQERLKKKYGSIGVLNERWGSKYGSFEEIQPPEDWRLKPERVPGLTCEFERFRQDSWHAWQKQCHAWLRDRLPGKNIPNSCDITSNGGGCVDGLDVVKLFETFDIVMEHAYLAFAKDPALYRYYENLREAFKSTTGIGEWYVSAPELFNEQAIRNNGLRQTFQQVQWGRSALIYWNGHGFNFFHNGNWTEQRLGHTVLRYESAYIPLGIARAKAHRAIYLEYPLVQPDVGILESESSFYNVCNVRHGMGEFTGLFFNKGHDYGNLFERLVMDGRQNLDKYKVVILPNAECLPDAFAEKLLAWVKAGGVLLTTGPAGVMNELGVKGGKLPDEVLGAGQWTYEKGKMSVKEGSPGLNILALDSSKRPALIAKDLGKGKVCMRLNPVKEDVLYGVISQYAPRKFYGKDNRFHLAMRQGKKGELYLSVLNPDLYEQLDDEIVLEGEYKTVADVSCNFPILPEIKDGKTSFKVSLAPAEGVMIRIQK